MFRLSYNTHGLRNLSLDRAVREVSEAGYEGVELFLLPAHLHPFEVTSERLDKLNELFASLPIEPVCLSTGWPFLLSDDPFEPSLISTDEQGRKERIRVITRSLEIANYLSIPVVQFVSGIRKEDVSAELATQMLIDGVRTSLASAGEAVLVIEPEAPLPAHMGGGRCFVETTAQAIPIIQEVNSPQFRLNLDISHVESCESDLLQATSDALPYTRHIHVADIKGKVHHHEIPGEGDIDFRSVFDLLSDADYEHYLSVELYAHADVWERALYQSRKYLLDQMKPSEGKE